MFTDWLTCQPTACVPLMEHWVNVEATDELIPKCFANFARILQKPDRALEHTGIMWGPHAWAGFLYSAGMTHWYDEAASLMAQAGLTYKTAHATLETCLTPWVRKRGDTTMNVHYCSAESWAWEAQMAYVLVSSDPGVSAKEILAGLPTIEDIVRCTITWDELSPTHAVGGGYASNLFYHVAAVCEKFGRTFGDFERALNYVDAALSTDLPRGGTQMPTSRVVFSILRGRALVSLGRVTEAANVLEAAAEMAQQLGARLYELHALRDLKLLVLDDLGHGEHASRRLGAVLRLLKGPADKLTPMLKGLDAGELMALPPPDLDASYRVVYEVEDTALAALRQELQVLRLTALQKRAEIEGVNTDEIADAMDSAHPKTEIIELLLVQSETSASKLREELLGLRVTALQKRAHAAGVGDAQVDDAMDSDDPKGALIALIVAVPHAAPAAEVASTSRTETLAEIIDHLREGNASQRVHAYTELEKAIATRNVSMLNACVPATYEVMCKDASEVDPTE